MKTIHLLICALILSFLSCEKTVDSETNRWNRSQARLERLTSEYPNFRSALQAQLNEARPLFEQAEQYTDEESRMEWLGKANRAASPSYVNQLDNLDRKIEKLRESAVKLFEYSESNKGVLIAGLKSVNIESTIKDSKEYLSSVQVSDKYQADQVVRKAVGKLDRLQKSITDTLRKVEREMREAAN